MNFEAQACPICGHSEWDELSSFQAGGYRRCRSCRYHIQRSDGSSQRSRFETAQAAKYGNTDLADENALFDYLSGQRQTQRLEILRRFLPSGRLLEVGPGGGSMLALAQAAGYDIDAVEQSAELSQSIVDRLGVQVWTSEFETLDLAPDSYDGVLSFHVIEHVVDVRAHMLKAASVTKPGGIAIVATPSVDSWEHRFPGGLSPNYSDAHLQLFSKSSIRMLVESAGWSVEELHTPTHAEYWVRVLTSLARRMQYSLKQSTTPRGSFAASNGPKSTRMLGALKVFGRATMPLRYVQSRLGLGNEIVVVARKL